MSVMESTTSEGEGKFSTALEIASDTDEAASPTLSTRVSAVDVILETAV